MNTDMNTDPVVVVLTETNALVRWPCHVCGGCTEKYPVLAEVQEGEHEGFRVCETCIKAGDFDSRLLASAERLEREASTSAERLERQASDLRLLVGRLRVPTYKEWAAAMRRYEPFES